MMLTQHMMLIANLLFDTSVVVMVFTHQAKLFDNADAFMLPSACAKLR